MRKQNDLDVVWLAIAIILFLACYTNCQDFKHISLHTDRDEWEDNIGLKFVTVTSKDSELVYFYQKRKLEIKSSSLGYDSDSRFKDDGKNVKFSGCFVVIYCKKHLMIYVMQRVPCFDKDNDSPQNLKE